MAPKAYALGAMTKFGGYTVEDAKKIFDESFKEMLSCKVRAYNVQYQVVGKKPEA